MITHILQMGNYSSGRDLICPESQSQQVANLESEPKSSGPQRGIQPDGEGAVGVGGGGVLGRPSQPLRCPDQPCDFGLRIFLCERRACAK